jgi:rod shape-determining protein MreC
MPLGTLDGTPPPFFRQGPSALSKLVLFSTLAVLLMVSDKRFAITQPLRTGIAVALYPLQWALMRPVAWATSGSGYLSSLQAAQRSESLTKFKLGLQSQRAQQVEELQLENRRLRSLLDVRERLQSPALAAQVLYDAADPYSRKVVIDKGQLAAVQLGAPVLDEYGVLGQVTRVYPLVSEVTLLSDHNQAIPVLNTRSGVRAMAMGNPNTPSDDLQLRYMDAHVDMQVDDLLSTSGIDGVYPPGLAVARISHVDKQGDSAFANITATPVAHISSNLHVLVLEPIGPQIPPAPEPPNTKDKRGKSSDQKSVKKDKQP